MNRARVFLVDDHPLVRRGLMQMINQEPDLIVCGEAESANGALDAFAEAVPDLVVIDVSLRSSEGIGVIRDLRKRFPGTAVLVLTMHDESFYAERALRAGAQGFLSKQEAGDEMLAAIRGLLKGEMYVSDRLSPKLLKRLVAVKHDAHGRPVGRLSRREREVFLLLGQGLGTREIAGELGLSAKTIETYRANIKEKLDLRDARELLQCAVQWVLSQENG